VVLIAVSAFIFLSGSKSRNSPTPPSAPEVEVVQAQQDDVPIYGEWIGTLDGMVNAEIKSQVSGYLMSKQYVEGSFVKKGQLLFEIDPRPFQAAVDQAKGDLARAEGQLAQANGQQAQAQAQLAQAEANQVKTQLDENRYTTLVRQSVVSREQFDDAVQANRAAKAQVKAFGAGVESSTAAITAAKAAVAAAKAAVQSAALNLSFTRITSPIDGIAGIAQAQIGNLVQPNNPNSAALTTVSQVDPIKVYFTLSEQEYLNLARDNPTQRQINAANRKLELELTLADGSAYPQNGKFFVADRQVDQKTGSIRMAGVFPNPGNVLRPGQYGKVRAVTSMRTNAVLVPQRAVSELQGTYQVAVVDSDNKVAIRPVKVGQRVDAMWIIEDGLKPGETVIAEGTQKVRPGTEVIPKPFASGD
jgi:membrane fusion protein (multidrug efflux system)